jgi:pyruvate/2-oxoglutarate dehydrogenase complex dihydrolipoamide acyltransferase (E2) component
LLLGSVIVGAALLTSPGGGIGLGLSPAAAATRHYTRKKVNGRWVTGKFTAGAADAKEAGKAAKPGARRVRFVEKRGFPVKAGYASLPRFKPKVVLRPAATMPTETKPADSAAKQQAPAAPASSADRVIATASISPAPPVHPAPERMRPALEARARSLASELGIVSLPLPEAAPPVQLTARSVTFDLEKGVRTIVFEDGATVTAPFDKGRASDVTGLRPAR